MKKRISFAAFSGYIIGVLAGVIWVGSGDTLLIALISAPLFIFISANEFIWGQTAFMITLIAIFQLITLVIVGHKTERPTFTMIGSFIFTGLFAFLGGSTAASIASV